MYLRLPYKHSVGKKRFWTEQTPVVVVTRYHCLLNSIEIKINIFRKDLEKVCQPITAIKLHIVAKVMEKSI